MVKEKTKKEEQVEEKLEEAAPEEPKEEKKEEKPAEETKVEEEEKEKEKEEPKPEKKPEEPKPEKKPAPTGKYKDLIKQIESLSLTDLAELVKELEKRFGVSAGTVVPTTPGAPTPTPGAPSASGMPPVSEKVRFTLILSSAGTNKIAVIKAVREIKPDLGLKDAKDFVEAAPKTLLEDVSKEDAEKAKEKLEGAGATVELK